MDTVAATRIIREAFDTYRSAFDAITRRARARYEDRDWHGIQEDSVERLGLYRLVIDHTVAQIREGLADSLQDRAVWARLKEGYQGLTAARADRDLAETFFNSVTRRIFSTVGVDPAIEFVDPGAEEPPAASGPVFRSFRRRSTTRALVRDILRAFSFQVPYISLEADAEAAAAAVERALGAGSPDEAEMAAAVFYRNKGAYLVGRLRSGKSETPLILCLLHEDRGIALDAVLLGEDAASIVFGFTRSYFHVEAERPGALVHFLHPLMPLKKVAELYISIGFNKHGKTELYRDLRRHLEASSDRFESAPGERGMVMTVFTLPSYDMVFKIIRDRFAEPKATTRQAVMQKYDLVFRHDRAGRLIDAQEFEHVQFERRRFSDELLAELLATASRSVSLRGDHVVIGHLYAERRLTPLNLHLTRADEKDALAAVVDYGQAIRDLAATNIFPGDILLKNFGVTRHGRVVFYDYDELALLTDCRFRDLPAPEWPEQELDAEPWYYVGPNDLFPEEFIRFLGLRGRLRDSFLDTHAELLTAAFWRRMQERLRAGEIVDIFPYPQDARIRRHA